MREVIALITGCIFLGLFNYSIAKNERHLAEGETVILELAPVDPRSLMQGDFMRLNYQVTVDIRRALNNESNSDKTEIKEDGWIYPDDYVSPQTRYAIVSLDKNMVATFEGLVAQDIHESTTMLKDNQVAIQFRVRDNKIKFATNAYFFAEGSAEAFEAARYGQFAMNKNGEVLLKHMLDEDLKVIAP